MVILPAMRICIQAKQRRRMLQGGQVLACGCAFGGDIVIRE